MSDYDIKISSERSVWGFIDTKRVLCYIAPGAS
jgi:hypothetical protein